MAVKTRVERLERKSVGDRAVTLSAEPTTSHDYTRYAGDLCGFAADVLKVTLTPDQQGILKCLPGRAKVKAGHSVGKTFLAACAVLGWHWCYDPSVVITTAPTERDVIDLLWTEVRLLSRRAGLPERWVGPVAPEMYHHEDHWAKGYTARRGESFQGRHRPQMLFVFDEDEGIEESYWKTTNTMYQPDHGHGWLSIGNPTTTTSQSFAEESLTDLDGSPKWQIHTLSCLNHPNVLAGLRGDGTPIPNAVTVSQVDGWVAEWCDPVLPGDEQPGDFEWRPGSGQFYRPGPEFQSRVMGLRPTAGVDSVWSEAAFDAAVTLIGPDGKPVPNIGVLDPTACPELGVDVARYGSDWSAIHERCGRVSLSHRTGQGWSVPTTVGRSIEAADKAAAGWNGRNPSGRRLTGKDVRIKVDDTGVGGGVTDLLAEQGYSVVGVNAGTRPNRPDRYRLRRDELWFDLAKNPPCLGRLDKRTIARLRQQFLAPKYKIGSDKRRQVESKDELKKRGVRSPDDADSVNLAYCEGGGFEVSVVGG